MKSLWFIFICLLFTTSCGTSPLGRKQILLFPSAKMNEMGSASFAQLESKTPTIKDPTTLKYIRCITDRLLLAMNEDPNKWQIEVFKDDSPNAFALPGNKMGIHTGMISLAQNQDQLAAVIGHEIGHVKAHHSNERISQEALGQAGLQVGSIVLGTGKETDALIFGALGLGLQFGILSPYSRVHETEADRLGQIYMAKAGFDPRQAPELWKLMSKNSGKSIPEFFSSHPSNESRIKDLNQRAEKYMPDYEKSTKSICKK